MLMGKELLTTPERMRELLAVLRRFGKAQNVGVGHMEQPGALEREVFLVVASECSARAPPAGPGSGRSAPGPAPSLKAHDALFHAGVWYDVRLLLLGFVGSPAGVETAQEQLGIKLPAALAFRPYACKVGPTGMTAIPISAATGVSAATMPTFARAGSWDRIAARSTAGKRCATVFKTIPFYVRAYGNAMRGQNSGLGCGIGLPSGSVGRKG